MIEIDSLRADTECDTDNVARKRMRNAAHRCFIPKDVFGSEYVTSQFHRAIASMNQIADLKPDAELSSEAQSQAWVVATKGISNAQDHWLYGEPVKAFSALNGALALAPYAHTMNELVEDVRRLGVEFITHAYEDGQLSGVDGADIAGGYTALLGKLADMPVIAKSEQDSLNATENHSAIKLAHAPMPALHDIRRSVLGR